MPKKFTGENSKAVAAKARKAAVKEQESIKKQQELDDNLWKDDDKSVLKKSLRKEEKEKKRQEQLERKANNKALLDEESSNTKTNTTNSIKVTRAQIQEKKTQQEKVNSKNGQDIEEETKIEENINRDIAIESSARSITEAIAILDVNKHDDKHPERRLKAAYTAYEEKYMPILKIENPTFRHSQLKQLLRKMWMKAEENPFNQTS